MKSRAIFLAILGLCLIPTTAQAGAALGFHIITDNDPGGDSELIGEEQLSVSVSDLTPGQVPGQVSFTFHNSGSGTCSLADVYFDNGVLQNISIGDNPPGVCFSLNATPRRLGIKKSG
jgi:hypothetical protein